MIMMMMMMMMGVVVVRTIMMVTVIATERMAIAMIVSNLLDMIDSLHGSHSEYVIFCSRAPTILRAFWKTSSSVQSAFSEASPSAMRLCIRKKTVWRAPKPGYTFTRESPDEKEDLYICACRSDTMG